MALIFKARDAESLSNGPVLDPFIETTEISNWSDFEKWSDKLSDRERIAYRGQEDSRWGLKTSLERFLSKTNHSTDMYQTQDSSEDVLRSEFTRGAHHFNVEPLDEDDEFGWLALMQHYGAPTRLLDWTQSPYVALFFAVESKRAECSSSVYAMDIGILETALHEHWHSVSFGVLNSIKCLANFSDSIGTPEERTKSVNEYLRHFKHDGLTGIVAARPFKMNQRLALQRGLFVLPLSLELSFESQLAEVLGSYTMDRALFVGHISEKFPRRDILTKLDAMNIHPASLFPTLDGYARSVKMRYEIYRLHTLI